ncbi:hypothetical protein [Nannocystis radixulma]|uniref:DUF3108 domain-containing protein n=1 Tax=Nannocystis radixulma TaxID=2995305 RepID=A0ABT5AXR9_9BACT|nr:hypothetical protein [Nannocystis radixulma]MDC0666626.1 hypothetical protein [Nannocystis radixulma]
MLRPYSTGFLLACVTACGDPGPSRLQQREQAPVPEVAPPASSAPVGASGPAAQAEPAAPKTPPPPSERAEIHLSLKEGSTYRVTTIGNIRFGSLVQPTGFAREERLTLKDCDGESFTRVCTLEHRYVNFEAEPPNGKFLVNDEKAVDQLVTSHRLLATGERPGTTTVTGPKEQADSKAGQALVDANRFFCIRFPEEAIGVGAKWRSKCQMRSGGVVDTRDVLWELMKLERDPEMGLRAELTYVGQYTAPGAKTSVQGVVRGTLFFFVEAGEPHLLREEFTTATDTASKYVTHSTLAYQFVKLVPGPDGKEIAVRVDGKPLPEAPAMNAPTPEAASGATGQASGAKAEAGATTGDRKPGAKTGG